MILQQDWSDSFIGIYHSPDDLVAGSLGDRALALLRWRILNGVFVGGDKIREQVVARELGVSRGTIREATRRLYGAGLVEIDAQRGVFVRTYTLEQIIDIIEVRKSLSDLIATLFLERATEADHDRIKALYARLLESKVTSYCNGDYITSVQFTEAFVRAANSDRVYTLEREAWQQMRIFKLFLRRQIGGPVDFEAFNRSMFVQGTKHRLALYNAISSGSRSQIAGAMRDAADASLNRARVLFDDFLELRGRNWPSLVDRARPKSPKIDGFQATTNIGRENK
ncbi:GntR family transcriptional regulator [Alphaproteobacteria bacterium LSUCC0719]